jgi:hypothetical protein
MALVKRVDSCPYDGDRLDHIHAHDHHLIYAYDLDRQESHPGTMAGLHGGHVLLVSSSDPHGPKDHAGN